MLNIAVTGGIGSGKSIVCKVFRKLNIPIYDADSKAKELYTRDCILKQQMLDLFGSTIYEGNEINKAILSGIIFKDKSKLEIINEIVPAAIQRDFALWKNETNSPITVFEAAILFERNMQAMFDIVITVTAPLDLRIKRCMERNNISELEIRNRIDAQWTDEKRLALSHFSIINDDDHAILPQVFGILEKINKI